MKKPQRLRPPKPKRHQNNERAASSAPAASRFRIRPRTAMVSGSLAFLVVAASLLAWQRSQQLPAFTPDDANLLRFPSIANIVPASGSVKRCLHDLEPAINEAMREMNLTFRALSKRDITFTFDARAAGFDPVTASFVNMTTVGGEDVTLAIGLMKNPEVHTIKGMLGRGDYDFGMVARFDAASSGFLNEARGSIAFAYGTVTDWHIAGTGGMAGKTDPAPKATVQLRKKLRTCAGLE